MNTPTLGLSTVGSSTRRDFSYREGACRLDMAIARDGRCSPFGARTFALGQVEQAGEALRSKFSLANLANLHLASLWAALMTRTIVMKPVFSYAIKGALDEPER